MDSSSRETKTVTVFVGSARRKGAAYAAAQRFLGRLETFGDVRGEIVVLSEFRLGLCRGCKACFERGEERCPLKDDRDALIEKMDASDGVVFASPNYAFQVSAFMKVFLDRLGFLFHRPRFHGKTFSGIVVQGFHGGGKIVKYLEFAGLGLGFNVVKGACLTALEPMTSRETSSMEKALARQAARFHKRMFGPSHPVPSFLQILMFRGGRGSARFLAGEDNRDHVHYRDRGWFDSDYFYPTRLGLLKRAAGAAVDGMVVRSALKRNREIAPRLVSPAGPMARAAEKNG